MKKTTARYFGVILAALAVVGLFVSRHLFGLINVDGNVDVLRLIMAALLLYAGFITLDTRVVSVILVGFGLSHLLIGAIALFDSEVGGFAPSGFTGFDVVFYIAAGAFATWAGIKGLNLMHFDSGRITRRPGHTH